MEVKIPWSAISMSTPADNKIIAMSFGLNDKDSTGKWWVMWPDITTAFENASKWKPVLLSGTTVTPDITPTYGITNFTQLATDWLKTISSPADITKDGIVDSRDLCVMMNNWKP